MHNNYDIPILLLCNKKIIWASYIALNFLVISLKVKSGKAHFNNIFYFMDASPPQNSHGKRNNLSYLHQCNIFLDPVPSSTNLHNCMIHVKFKFQLPINILVSGFYFLKMAETFRKWGGQKMRGKKASILLLWYSKQRCKKSWV